MSASHSHYTPNVHSLKALHLSNPLKHLIAVSTAGILASILRAEAVTFMTTSTLQLSSKHYPNETTGINSRAKSRTYPLLSFKRKLRQKKRPLFQSTIGATSYIMCYRI
uniref:Secreted protein n=1 Tax=Ascaris lumbricoides TaxID=6252 RepID=A0A0M3IXB5_ASCLU